jgi:hypothetical protein
VASSKPRVTALEAERLDSLAALVAVNALGANQRHPTARLADVEGTLGAVERRLRAAETTSRDTTARLRSHEDQVAPR